VAQGQATSTSDSNPGVGAGRVFAQGQLLPADGIVKIFSTPGDVVANLPVQVGSAVHRGQVLAVMRSAEALLAKRAALEQQKEMAKREKASTVRQAELKCAAAELKLRQNRLQRSALVDQRELIKRGEKQLQASESILESLRKISIHELTREFVGRLEVEQQSIALEDSRLQWAEQKSAYQRSELELGLAEEAASQELEAAKALLQLAQESDVIGLLDLQLAALDVESAQSTLKAPSDGVVLSVGASVGGSAVQGPLLELASLVRIVCETEVNVTDASRVAIGQKASMRSRAMEGKQLTGVVTEKSRLVGRPRLRALDPLAAADYRTIVVMVQLDDPAWASQWLQLQVEVVFEP